MNSLIPIAGAAVAVAAMFATFLAYEGTSAPDAGGACGTTPEAVAANSIQVEDFEGVDASVPMLFYRVDYSGLQAPTIIAVMSFYNDLQTERGMTLFRVLDSSGSFGSVARMNIGPVAQRGAELAAMSSKQTDDSGIWQRSSDTELMPGEYIFQVYSGSVDQTPTGPQFATSMSGYLGEFRCEIQS
ncbi:MAG: hypothetical protein AB7K36_31025 [Chloroflexota bacterium]